MKTVKSYISGLVAAVALGAGFTACQDDIDAPVIEVPVAVNQANTTIAELKAAFWQEASNYADSVRTKSDGSHYIIKGRVISSDEQSNVFKFISIQDETGAINFSVNSYNLYLNYRLGQEIVIDATGMYIGKYAGLQQFGTPSYYENGSTWQVGFMSPQFFQRHIELNGVPDVEKIDTITVNSFSEFDTSAEGLQKWQSQLVRINNVHFQDGGIATFSAYHSNSNDDVNKTLIDSEGNSIVVRTSGYANFWNETLPAGNGDIVGILSFYQNLAGSSMWQLILNDYEGCMNFGNPTVAPGTESNPYGVADVVKLEADGTPASGWVSGYIVGSVAPGVTEVKSDDDIVWSADALMPYTLVIGADKETKNLSDALIVELPANTPLRQYGNLRDNPANYGKAITIRGDFEKVMGSYGLTGNSGAASQFKIEGVQTGGEGIAEGNGSELSPYNPLQVIAQNPSSTTVATETGVWVKGYIVGYMPTDGSSTTLSGTVFGVTGNVANTNLVIASTPDETNSAKCVGVQLVAASVAAGVRDALNLASHPENLGKMLSIKGDIMKYCGGPGVKNGVEYTLDGQGSTVTPDPTPSDEIIFSSLSENSTTLPAGWTFENVNIGSLESVWSWKVYNDKGYLNASAYTANGNVATEAYAVSEVIDLTKASKPSLTFDHAAKFQTTLRQLCGVCARVEGSTQWTQLDIPVWPEAGAWTFVNSGNVSLTAFAGKKVQIAFKYGSTTSGADTWEVKNLNIYADGGGEGGTVTPDPGTDPVTPPASGEAVSIKATSITNVPGTTTVDGYAITIDKASGSTAPAFHSGTSAIRLYADNTIEIKGQRMTSIKFTLSSDNGYRYTTVQPSTGTISPAQAEGDTSFTWVGDASSVTFTIGHDATLGSEGSSKRGQVRFTQIDITPAM